MLTLQEEEARAAKFLPCDTLCYVMMQDTGAKLFNFLVSRTVSQLSFSS